jgi:hypothetical protein
MTPTASTMTVRAQRTLFDIDTMDKVTLVKEAPFKPVLSRREALERLGGSEEKFLEILNEGLRAEIRRNILADTEVLWHKLDDDGKVVPYHGTPANPANVNAAVLTIAKSMVGYNRWRVLDSEHRRAARDKAVIKIKSDPDLLNGFRNDLAGQLEPVGVLAGGDIDEDMPI